MFLIRTGVNDGEVQVTTVEVIVAEWRKQLFGVVEELRRTGIKCMIHEALRVTWMKAKVLKGKN